MIHLLQTIGEASRKVGEAWRRDHPEIQWPKIVGMRNRIVHDYRNVNIDIVWDIATTEIPLLIAALTLLIPSDPP